MSVRSVRNEIQKAMHLTPRTTEKQVSIGEAYLITREAKKGGVTEGELALLKDLSKNGTDPMGIMTAAVPELRGDAYYLSKDAKAVIDTFVSANGGTDQSTTNGGTDQSTTRPHNRS